MTCEESIRELALYLNDEAERDPKVAAALKTGRHDDRDAAASELLELLAEKSEFEERMQPLVSHGRDHSNDWARCSALREAIAVSLSCESTASSREAVLV